MGPEERKFAILKWNITGYTYMAIPDKQVSKPPTNPPMKPPVTTPALLLVCAVAEGDPCVDAGVDSGIDSANFSLTLLQVTMLL